MVKRKHEETEEKTTADILKEASAGEKDGLVQSGSRQMQGQGEDKHTIDSDDEDDERKREESFVKMKDDDIDGQEDNTEMFDGDIPITPFNLKEEQQEGAFSKDGDFVWNKKEGIKDAWLDDIDWVKVKQRTAGELAKQEEEEEKEEEEELKYSEMGSYRSMLELMKPKESVAKALKRLGGGKKAMSASERWKRKKAGVTEDPEEKKNKENMLKLTGLADAILSRSGNMEVYEETYESISYKLEQEKGAKTSIPEGVDDDDALDMFADSLDDKKDAKSEENSAAVAPPANGGKPAVDPPTVKFDDAVMWEFKWKNEEGEEVHGPHSSEKMLEWQESDFFKAGVWCRKVGSTGDFSTSKRIDFDLYT